MRVRAKCSELKSVKSICVEEKYMLKINHAKALFVIVLGHFPLSLYPFCIISM